MTNNMGNGSVEKQEMQLAADYEYHTLMRLLEVSVSKHLLDEHFTLIWANEFYYQLIGWTKEEYEEIFQNRPDKYYEQDKQEWERLVSTVMEAIEKHQNGYSLISPIRRKNGEYVWTKFSTVFAEEYVNGCQVAYTTMTNIDDLVRVQKEQSITYDNLPGFVAKFKVEKDGFQILGANDRFYEFFDCRGQDKLSCGMSNLETDQNCKAFEQNIPLMKKGEPVHFTLQAADRTGGTVWLQVNADCIEWVQELPVYQVIYIDITDITEQRALQKQLEEQACMLRNALDEAEKANRAKSDFLSKMSHDIRTPMNAIVGMTEIASGHLDNIEKVNSCLKKIALSSQHLLSLINDVLDMSKIESGKMSLRYESMYLPEVLENVIAIIQPMVKSRGQKLEIRLNHVQHEHFLCDSLRLRQVFINILSNASKFTPEGGSITINVEEHESNSLGIAKFKMAFSDTGIGIKPEFLEHIFDAFTREKDGRVDVTEGSGLGMAITQKIVELMNGKISVQSEVGKGTTFLVDLPLEVEDSSQEKWGFPGIKVLVADDDADTCEYTAQILAESGIDAEWVDNGADAVKKVVDAHENGKDFDAVIVDWKMPQQDGLQTVRLIRHLIEKEVPILIASAYDWTEIEDEAVAAGVNGFLPKPLFRSTLLHGISKYLLGQHDSSYARDNERNYDFTGRQILLVEDNELNREIAVEILSETGAKIECAYNGKEGFRMFAESAEHTYDLILMDVQMPVMDGYTATREIRGLQRKDAADIPILAMTADAFAEDIIAAREAGMNGHIAKPLNIAELKQKIDKLLRNKELHNQV